MATFGGRIMIGNYARVKIMRSNDARSVGTRLENGVPACQRAPLQKA